MTKPPVLTLRDAVLAIVKALPDVAAVCGSRIADVVLATGPVASLPSVSCGPASWVRAENGTDGLPLLRLRLFVASAEPKRDQAWTLAHRIAEALEGQQPALGGGYHLIDILRVTQMGDVIDKIAPTEVFVDITTIAQAD